MEALIRRLNGWLASNRTDYYSHLLPGVSESQLDEMESLFELKLPESFRQLYRWRNGQDHIQSASLVNNLMFSPLEEIVRAKELMDGMIGSDFEDPRWWRRSWIPFLENGAGDHLCLDLAAEDGGTPGQLLMFYHDWDNRPIRARSLENWLEELLITMESGSLQLA